MVLKHKVQVPYEQGKMHVPLRIPPTIKLGRALYPATGCFYMFINCACGYRGSGVCLVI
jgi:hypothetical protein